MSDDTQAERILANCKFFWGDGNYDVDLETDDLGSYIGFVKKDFGTHFGEPLTMTGVCPRPEHAWWELDRKLELGARLVKSGAPLTKEDLKNLDIQAESNRQERALAENFLASSKKRALEASKKSQQILQSGIDRLKMNLEKERASKESIQELKWEAKRLEIELETERALNNILGDQVDVQEHYVEKLSTLILDRPTKLDRGT